MFSEQIQQWLAGRQEQIHLLLTGKNGVKFGVYRGCFSDIDHQKRWVASLTASPLIQTVDIYEGKATGAMWANHLSQIATFLNMEQVLHEEKKADDSATGKEARRTRANR